MNNKNVSRDCKCWLSIWILPLGNKHSLSSLVYYIILQRLVSFDYNSDILQDVTKLTALSPEVISRQATINIGTIGHVAHGKSTVVKAISGVQTVRFKNELERNITIKLGKFLVNDFLHVAVDVYG